MKRVINYLLIVVGIMLFIATKNIDAQTTGKIDGVKVGRSPNTPAPNPADLTIKIDATATTTNDPATIVLRFRVEQKTIQNDQVVWVPIRPLANGDPVEKDLKKNTSHRWNTCDWFDVDVDLGAGEYRVIATIIEKNGTDPLDTKTVYFNF